MDKTFTALNVIGSNYGDEGKGLVTDFLVEELLMEKKKPIVFCNNGGSQRGHTVVRNNITHVFHHFGSGTLLGVPTFLGPNFIVNPMTFMSEFDELTSKGVEVKDLVNIHNDCLVSIPYDMLANLYNKSYKGGTCGVGIWETILRNSLYENRFFKFGNLYTEFNNRPLNKFYELVIKNLKDIRDNYYMHSMSDRGIELTEEQKQTFLSDGLIAHYLLDLVHLLEITKYYNSLTFSKVLENNGYDSVVIENGQGLAISKEEDKENGTPSETGSYNAITLLKMLEEDYKIEICNYYVTRWYLTRHGRGDFPEEVVINGFKPNTVTDLFPSFISYCASNSIRNSENTNKNNSNQGEFRVGFFKDDKSINRFNDRIYKDFNYLQPVYKNTNIIELEYKIIVTHMDESDKILSDKEIYDQLGKRFLSDIPADLLVYGRTAKDVRET